MFFWNHKKTVDKAEFSLISISLGVLAVTVKALSSAKGLYVHKMELIVASHE